MASGVGLMPSRWRRLLIHPWAVVDSIKSPASSTGICWTIFSNASSQKLATRRRPTSACSTIALGPPCLTLHIPDCQAPAVAKSLCAKHAMRLRRHGDPAKVNRRGRKDRDAPTRELMSQLSDRTYARFLHAVRLCRDLGVDPKALIQECTRAKTVNFSEMEQITEAMWPSDVPRQTGRTELDDAQQVDTNRQTPAFWRERLDVLSVEPPVVRWRTRPLAMFNGVDAATREIACKTWNKANAGQIVRAMANGRMRISITRPDGVKRLFDARSIIAQIGLTPIGDLQRRSTRRQVRRDAGDRRSGPHANLPHGRIVGNWLPARNGRRSKAAIRGQRVRSSLAS
jgi:hypothetical protein